MVLRMTKSSNAFLGGQSERRVLASEQNEEKGRRKRTREKWRRVVLRWEGGQCVTCAVRCGGAWMYAAPYWYCTIPVVLHTLAPRSDNNSLQGKSDKGQG